MEHNRWKNPFKYITSIEKQALRIFLESNSNWFVPDSLFRFFSWIFRVFYENNEKNWNLLYVEVDEMMF